MSGKLVVVDDEEYNLSALARILRRVLPEGHSDVVFFSSPLSAKEYLLSNEVAVLLTDYLMPGMTGLELIAALGDRETIRVLISANADFPVLASAINEGHISAFISKPWDEVRLAEVVLSSLAKYEERVSEHALADVTRVMFGEMTEEQLLLRKLEEESPGITKVERDADGAILLKDEH